MLADGKRFDAIVVGGGPAGASAAASAARHGASTLLLEKRPVVGSPVRCAEGMTSDMLASCGLKLRDEWISWKLSGARILSPSGHSIKVDAPDGAACGYVLDRERFDAGLALDAANAGATVLAGSPLLGMKKAGEEWVLSVRTSGAGRTFRSPVVIGADGFESQVARWSGMNVALEPRDRMSCAEFTLDRICGDARFFEFHVDNQLAPGGYAWVFWKSGSRANVGVGIRGDFLDGPAMPLRALEAFIASKPNLACGRRVRALAGGAPVAAPPKTCTRDGVMLAGDAARVCNPLHGGGISNAIITGTLAGEKAARVLDGLSPMEAGAEYDRSWHSRLDGELMLSYAMREIVGSSSNREVDEMVEKLATIPFHNLDLRTMMEKVITMHPHLGAMMRR